MANKKNLIPGQHRLTVEEASRGGKKSAEKRLKLRDLRETARAVLELDTIVKINDKPVATNYATALILALVQRATAKRDAQSVAAARTLIQLVGADKVKEERDLLRAQIALTEARADALKPIGEGTGYGKLDQLLEEMRTLALDETPDNTKGND